MDTEDTHACTHMCMYMLYPPCMCIYIAAYTQRGTHSHTAIRFLHRHLNPRERQKFK